MRTKLVIGILLVFCLAEIKPYLPLLDYALNYEYISEVLCVNKNNKSFKCQGMCYVSDKLSEAQDSETGSQKIPPVELDSIPMLSSYAQLPDFLIHHTPPQTKWRGYSFTVKDLIITPPSPPPRC